MKNILINFIIRDVLTTKVHKLFKDVGIQKKVDISHHGNLPLRFEYRLHFKMFSAGRRDLSTKMSIQLS